MTGEHETWEVRTRERLPAIITAALNAVSRGPQVLFGAVAWSTLLSDLQLDCWRDELLTGARDELTRVERDHHLLGLDVRVDEDLRHAHCRWLLSDPDTALLLRLSR